MRLVSMDDLYCVGPNFNGCNAEYLNELTTNLGSFHSDTTDLYEDCHWYSVGSSGIAYSDSVNGATVGVLCVSD